MSNLKFRLKLKSTFEESEKIPDFVSSLQSKASLTEDETSTLMLLVSEAVTNAIEHGNKLDPSKDVDIEISIADKEISTIVKDQGPGFDPEETDDPLQEENLLNARGRGVFLLKELSDDITYSDGGRTVKFRLNRN